MGTAIGVGIGVVFGGGLPGPSIALSASSIAENATNGTAIGNLSVSNPPTGHGVYVFTVNADPDGLFNISGGALDKNGTLDYEAAQSHLVQIKADDSTTPVILQWLTISVTNVAPVLSNPTDTKTGQTTADITVDTTETTGTLYWVVTTSGTPPTAAQIKAGKDNAGVAAAASGTQAISTSGTKSVSVTGLTAATAYTAHFMHEEGMPNFADSNVASGDGFTTDAAGSWQTSFTDTLSDDGSGAEDFSIRSVIDAANISLSGATIRVTLKGSSANPSSADNVSIMERSGSTSSGAAAPTELLFNGGQHGFSLSAGQSIVSDALTFTLDEAKDYLVTVDVSAANGSYALHTGGRTAYYQPSLNGYATQSGVAYTSGAANNYYVSKIEVFA